MECAIQIVDIKMNLNPPAKSSSIGPVSIAESTKHIPDQTRRYAQAGSSVVRSAATDYFGTTDSVVKTITAKEIPLCEPDWDQVSSSSFQSVERRTVYFSAAFRLPGSATPLPAMSKAVPWAVVPHATGRPMKMVAPFRPGCNFRAILA